MENFKKFYEKLYKRERVSNPAYEIYDRLRVETIRHLIDNSNGNALIIGCGAGQDANIFDSSIKVIAFDLSWNASRSIKSENIISFVGDATSIPLPDDYFDLVICSEVLEHIPNVRNAIQEIYRIAKQNSILIFSSPNWLSFFGLARWLLEKIGGKAVHSSGQPYDDWKTIWTYRSELYPYFSIQDVRGVWYLPPLHYNGFGVSQDLMKSIFRLYKPLERLFSKFLPFFGHIIVLKTKPNK
jgi:SAM-dependent methyltransferase